MRPSLATSRASWKVAPQGASSFGHGAEHHRIPTSWRRLPARVLGVPVPEQITPVRIQGYPAAVAPSTDDSAKQRAAAKVFGNLLGGRQEFTQSNKFSVKITFCTPSSHQHYNPTSLKKPGTGISLYTLRQRDGARQSDSKFDDDASASYRLRGICRLEVGRDPVNTHHHTPLSHADNDGSKETHFVAQPVCASKCTN